MASHMKITLFLFDTEEKTLYFIVIYTITWNPLSISSIPMSTKNKPEYPVTFALPSDTVSAYSLIAIPLTGNQNDFARDN